MKKYDKLLYSLIFSDVESFVINVSQYTDNIKLCDDFIRNIKVILDKSKVTLLYDETSIVDKSFIWKIKVKR